MRVVRTARVVAGVLVAAVGAWLATACTHDFEAFDPGSTGPLTEGDAASDAPIARPDAASGDAAPGTDARVDAGCTPAAACVTTGDACNTTCDADQATCASKCGGGGGSGRFCRDRCDSDRDRCKSTCSSTCRTCATDLCSSACH